LWVEALSAYVVARHADVLDALLRPAELSSARQSGPGAATTLAAAVVADPSYPAAVRAAARRRLEIAPGAPVLVNADPPRHGEQRRLFNKTFSPRRVASLEEPIRRLAEHLVDDALAATRPGAAVDLVGTLAMPLPMTVIAQALGCADVELDALKRWSDAFVRANGRPDLPRDAVIELFTAMDEAYDFFTAQLADRRQHPRDDLVTDVVEAGTELSGHEQLQALVLFLTGGNETTNSLIASCCRQLAEDPALQSRLREHPELIPAFVEEVLRLEPPVQGLFRLATVDTQIGGVTVAAGSFVWLLYGSCNRDSGVFGEPDELRLDRTEGRDHLSFAQGPHYCLGANLARTEARIAVETLLARTARLRLAPEEDLSCWTPNLVQHGLTRLLVELTPA
ncbi:MAG: cytochrome P450, partial [Mycobacteriales bacterium]